MRGRLTPREDRKCLNCKTLVLWGALCWDCTRAALLAASAALGAALVGLALRIGSHQVAVLLARIINGVG